MSSKIKVMHYYTYPQNAGGPLSYINNIRTSKYLENIDFGVCFQMKPASKIGISDIKKIINEIRNYNPDILHVHGLQSEGFIGVVVGKIAKVPRILTTVHGLQIDAQNITFLKRFIFRIFIEPYTLRHSDAVFCVCESTKQRKIIKNHSKKLLPTIHNFITDNFMNNDCLDVDFQKNKELLIISSVGRVSFDKGMIELEDCIKKDNYENTQYWIIGSGDYEIQMKKNLALQIQSKKVIFWGQQSNVKQYLKETDIFLFLSHHENLSIALLEAASQNCCCIATDVGGNGEIIDNNIDGLLVPSMDSNKAIEALNKVLNDKLLLKSMAKKIGLKVSFKFGEGEFCEQLLSVYKKIL